VKGETVAGAKATRKPVHDPLALSVAPAVTEPVPATVCAATQHPNGLLTATTCVNPPVHAEIVAERPWKQEMTVSPAWGKVPDAGPDGAAEVPSMSAGFRSTATGATLVIPTSANTPPTLVPVTVIVSTPAVSALVGVPGVPLYVETRMTRADVSVWRVMYVLPCVSVQVQVPEPMLKPPKIASPADVEVLRVIAPPVPAGPEPLLIV
jgi:hypothetical protein